MVIDNNKGPKIIITGNNISDKKDPHAEPNIDVNMLKKELNTKDNTIPEYDVRELLLDVCNAIREGGYNPVSQIVGFIVSEDPTHIANYKNARNLISHIDRDELLEDMVSCYIDRIEKDAAENEK